MPVTKKSFLSKIASSVLLSIFLLSCVDPVESEFEYIDGLVFIEGFASNEPGSSYVSIRKSSLEFGIYKSVFVKEANVQLKESNTGEKIQFTEEVDFYVPPDNFAVAIGSTWEVEIILSDGTTYQSYPETVINPVEIMDLTVVYEPELRLIESSGKKYAPGHRVSVSFNDPEQGENYYYWTYKTYENLDLCQRCYDGYFRDGACIQFLPGAPRVPYFDYICEVDCWKIRFPESIAIFEDKFSNGKAVSNLAVGELPLYTKENIVLEIEQFSLTPNAYQYYKVLKDIVDNNSGLNAPPPAGLIGNMYDPKNSENFVFGRFTVAAAAKASLFIDRRTISETALETKLPMVFEDTSSPVPPMVTNVAPCGESRFRTAIPPDAWISN